ALRGRLRRLLPVRAAVRPRPAGPGRTGRPLPAAPAARPEGDGPGRGVLDDRAVAWPAEAAVAADRVPGRPAGLPVRRVCCRPGPGVQEGVLHATAAGAEGAGQGG